MKLEETSITILKGIGEKRKKAFERLNIYNLEDLLTFYPKDYEERAEIVPIEELIINEVASIRGTISSIPQTIIKGRVHITYAKVKDISGTIQVTWFNQPYIKKQIQIGKTYIFQGKVMYKFGKLQMQPKEYRLADDESDYLKILPKYGLTKALSQKILHKTISETIDICKNQIKEYIPLQIRKKYSLCEINYAIKQIHFPDSYDSLEIAKKRLIFDEFFIFQTALLRVKSGTTKNISGNPFTKDNVIKKFIGDLPFKLTKSQLNVWKEIKQDLYSKVPMNRLIQGDVGSGKTIVAIIASIATINNGYQVALMAPTEVLARQHYKTFCQFASKYNIKIGLLVGSMSKKEKKNIYYEIENNTVQIVIGTHAIIQDTVTFHSLGLVITDEQHRFGVRQRVFLSTKGKNPNTLVMTATPIPRTLALILYGDLDISIIDELPPGRQKVETYSVTTKYRDRIYSFINKQLIKGHQAYIVCPLVEEGDKKELVSVIEYSSFLQEEIFKEYKVLLLHGKMKSADKDKIMNEFAKNKASILVATTVIEVGINVPNSTIMVIENAERFGLAQLHQLRGRVGRGKSQSYCILISDAKNQITKKRLEIMTKTNSGFEISELDLKLRGPGDFFGVKQHGLPEFKIANIYQDMEILKEVQRVANDIINNKYSIDKNEYNLLMQKIDLFLKRTNELIPL